MNTISIITSVVMMAVSVLGQIEYTPSTDTYLLTMFPVLGTANIFDGPKKVSNAAITTSSKSKQPTLEQMMYYNYYAVSTYCPYQLKDLSCMYCKKFNNDVDFPIAILNNDTHNTLCLITVSNRRKEIVVTFRGSEDIWNFVLDFAFFNYDTNGFKIHHGFYIATMSLYEKVVVSVGYQRSKHPEYKIVIVGHSLGGAIARQTLFFLLQLKQFEGAVYELYTYGEPRGGNKAYADFFNELNITTARCVARADIVPHVPPTSMFGTTFISDYYVQPQTEFWINGKKEQKFCNRSFYEDHKCSSSLGPTYTTLDHAAYFDVNYLVCGASNPASLAALPFGLGDPVNYFPPLPTLISDFASGAANFLFYLIDPIVGR